MTEEQQRVLVDAVQEASDLSFATFTELEADGKAKLEAEGMTMLDIDVDSFRACLPAFYEMCGWSDDFVKQINTTMEEYRASK